MPDASISSPVSRAGAKRPPAGFLSLLGKELRGSRGLLIAGFWSYWLMPVLLDIVYMIFLERALKTSGLLWILLQWVGWFYAVVVGAHVVCRDWGQAEEHFLRAQPVSAAAIVGAKFVAGLIVIGVLAAGVLAWSVPLNLHDPTPVMKAGASSILAIVVTLAVGYSVAFAAAFLSRQMLTGIIMGALALAVWWLGPWLSHWLDFLNPALFVTGLVESKDIPVSTAAFILAVAFVVIGSPLAALAAARREISLRLNSKAIAWSFTAVILLLFSMAMSEVGNSLTILDHIRLPEAMPYPSFDREYHVASAGSTGFFATDGSVTRIELTHQGTFADVQVAGLLHWLGPDDANQRRPRVLAVSAASPEDVTITLAMEWLFPEGSGHRTYEENIKRLPEYVQEGGPVRLCRWPLSWPARVPPKLISLTRRTVPAEAKSFDFVSAASTDRYAYVLLHGKSIRTDEGRVLVPETQPDRSYLWPEVLYAFDWTDEGRQEPIQRAANSQHRLLMQPTHGRLAIFRWADRGERPFAGMMGIVSIFDPDRPADIAQAFRTGVLPVASFEWNEVVTFEQTSCSALTGQCGEQSESYDAQRHLIYISTPGTMRVYNEKQEVVGEYEFGWLARLFRRYNMRSRWINNQRLLDTGNSALTVYDVSDPARIRRLGFHNLAEGWLTDAFPLAGKLLLIQPGELLVLDLP